MEEEECYYDEERYEMDSDMMDEEEEKCDMANIMSMESACMAMPPPMARSMAPQMQMDSAMAPQMESSSFEAHDMEGSASTTKPKFG